MRLEAKIKMGYYPTPLTEVERIRSLLTFPDRSVSVLDPCCGEGRALKNLVKDVKATTYGIELDEFRAEQSKANLDHVIIGSYEDARISNNAFSCLFLNPPYDWNTGGDNESFGNERKEKTFLKGTIKYLQPYGTLVYIIPQNRLTSDIAKILSYRFENFNVFKFLDGDYEAYRQIVLFGTKKHKSSLNDRDFYRLASIPIKTPPEIPYADKSLYKLPPSKEVRLFRSSIIDEKELESEARKSALWQKINGYNNNNNNGMGRPPLPLHTGHLGLLLANGCLDGVVGKGEDRHIVRGKVDKMTHKYDEQKGAIKIEREVETYRVSIKILKNDGDIITLM